MAPYESSKEPHSPFDLPMIAKFDDAFDNSPILKKDSKKLKDDDLQHLDDI